jgi:hypothetical protein
LGGALARLARRLAPPPAANFRPLKLAAASPRVVVTITRRRRQMRRDLDLRASDYANV